MEEELSEDIQNSEFTYGMYSLGLEVRIRVRLGWIRVVFGFELELGLGFGLLGLDNCNNKAILSNEDEHVLLYTGKRFELWDDCEDFVSAWAK
ncbi:hypothetical protein RIR_jg23604.t1 [Rhizophagus irregularis DAOM 181602=DAOM 197198]|uniref:Uncharacterized protein n=1 Tax=Rhizophagus irregularis (strain DAOM 181602 / DAOM 197198 / MUCL 43194) TaxID=747089 RepID=U9TYU9_RHIID|nr:hypothetical protein RIR_jg23604.t1 [Rhizophagus irregularis DAOM 181602=DAOM 197198]